MGTILDIINSTIIGGILLLIALILMDTTTDHFHSYGDDLIVQQNLTGTTKTLEYDLKKMGYGIPEWDSVVLIADSTHLKFRSDINKNGAIDTVEYYVGLKSELSATPNPDDRFLYRKINSTPTNGFKVGVVTNFNFDYLNQDGIIVDTSVPQNLIAIKMIRITLKIESSSVYGSNPNPDKNEYRTAFWQQTRLVSRNLRR